MKEMSEEMSCLAPASPTEISEMIKIFKIRKAPGKDKISNLC